MREVFNGMITATVDLARSRELTRAFDRLPLKVKVGAAEPVVLKTMNRVRDDAKAHVPIGSKWKKPKPGTLQRGIVSKLLEPKIYQIYGIVMTKPTAWYGRLIETGWVATGRSKSLRGKLGLTRKDYRSMHARLVAKGAKKRVPGRPWIVPALMRNWGYFNREFSAMMQYVIKREGLDVR